MNRILRRMKNLCLPSLRQTSLSTLLHLAILHEFRQRLSIHRQELPLSLVGYKTKPIPHVIRLRLFDHSCHLFSLTVAYSLNSVNP